MCVAVLLGADFAVCCFCSLWGGLVVLRRPSCAVCRFRAAVCGFVVCYLLFVRGFIVLFLCKSCVVCVWILLCCFCGLCGGYVVCVCVESGGSGSRAVGRVPTAASLPILQERLLWFVFHSVRPMVDQGCMEPILPVLAARQV